MMTKIIGPVRLVDCQRNQAAEVLVKAFQTDPAYTQLFPAPDERARSLRGLWRGVIGYCLVYGEVYTTPAVSGAACWLSPGNTKVTLWRTLRTGFLLPRAVMRFDRQARRRFMDVLAYMDGIHERLMSQPHWYLWALGVEPVHQGQGVGSALITPVLARADAARVPCYLETLDERNVPFYEKRGFAVAHEADGPGQGLRVWIMVREPGQ
jgi:GNAT superfamily N-acetyltransferase